jgi:single-strand DNA-binding protein
MSLNLNTVTLAGHLTRDPELRQAGERSVVNFGLAINRRWKSQEGEAKEETTFVDIEAWGRTAEIVGQYLAKGSPCYIEGRLKLDSWQDKEGQKRSKLKVVADNVQFLGRPRGAGEPAGEGDPTAAAAPRPEPRSANSPRPAGARPARATQPVGAFPAPLDDEQPPF